MRKLIVVAALLASLAAVPAAAERAVFSCAFAFASWPGGFSADLRIANHGPEIHGWTVRMEFAHPADAGQAWAATITQASPVELVATNLPWNARITSGGTSSFGWTATSVHPELPVVVSVNGTRC